MGGAKSELAQELATNVSANLEKVGGVEVAVIGFSGNRLIEHKRFDNTGRSSVCCIADLTNGSHHCSVGRAINYEHDSDGQNADLIAMEYGLDYLMRNKDHTSRPVFVMLSDGAPCSSPRSITVVNADQRSKTFESKFIRHQCTNYLHDTPMLTLLVSVCYKGVNKSLGIRSYEISKKQKAYC
jgi:hypothetical protein